MLFLDELGEFAPAALDGLREPLEEGVIRVSRAHSHAVLPARFLLVAATNPCPCGGGPPGWCECDDVARLRYLRRLSGPLLDRFDLRVAVQRPGVDDLLDPGGGEPSAVVAAPGRGGPGASPSTGPAASTPTSTAPLLDEFAPLTAGGARRCCAPRSSATGSPGAATTASAGSPAPSPTSRRPRPATWPSTVDVEHVEVALSLRTRLRAATPGLVA